MWREEVKKIEYQSSLDATMQPAMFFQPNKTDDKVPLLVGLHTWSWDCFQPSSGEPWGDWCIEQNWCFIYPNFRGPNSTFQSMGSELAVSDIVDAVNYAKNRVNIDLERIYLVGGSGGGYAALLLAGRYPEIWTAVSAWCPIIDLAQWHAECKAVDCGYYSNIEKALGGSPVDNPTVAAECKKRSAITYLHNAVGLPVDINTGIHDGHDGSVPISHALLGFNALAAPEDRLTEQEIESFVKNEAVPEHLQNESESDPLFGEHTPLFRRISGNVRITIFEGGHDILSDPSMNWLAAQHRGKDAVWQLKNTVTHDSVKTALGH